MAALAHPARRTTKTPMTSGVRRGIGVLPWGPIKKRPRTDSGPSSNGAPWTGASRSAEAKTCLLPPGVGPYPGTMSAATTMRVLAPALTNGTGRPPRTA